MPRKVAFEVNEIGYYVGHFLASTRRVVGNHKHSLLERVLITCPVLEKTATNLRLIEASHIPASLLKKNAARYIIKATEVAETKDNLSLHNAFSKVVRQVGWQARGHDFEEGEAGRVFSEDQKFLIQFNGSIDSLRQWSEAKPSTITQCLFMVVRDMERLLMHSELRGLHA